MSAYADLADAVKAHIDAFIAANAGTIEPMVARRAWTPEVTPEQLAGANADCTVVVRSVEKRPLSRKETYDVLTVDVAIRKQVEKGASASIDALTETAELLADYLYRPAGGWSTPDVRHDPLVDLDELHQSQVFTSLITLTFSR